jgi:hypothetical protein
MTPYEVVVLAGARQAIIEMDPEEQDLLAEALREELTLDSGPEVPIRAAGLENKKYFAKALSSGHVVVYRRMTDRELKEHEHSVDRKLAEKGFYLFDVLAPPSVPNTISFPAKALDE